jgi:hypothetical protein
MTIPRDLSNLAPGANTSGVLQPSKGGTGANTLTGVLKGNGTSAVTASNVNLATEVTGTLPVANGGTGLTSAGTAGNVLVSNGTGFVSSAPAGGGSLILINSTDYSGATDPTFTSGISSTYKVYKLYAQFYSTAGNFEIGIRFYANGSVDSNGVYNTRYMNSSGGFTLSSSLSFLPLLNVFTGGSIISAAQVEVTIYANFSQSGNFSTKISFAGCAGTALALLGGGNYVGSSGNNGPVTGIQFYTGGIGGITGTMSLYGVKNT